MSQERAAPYLEEIVILPDGSVVIKHLSADTLALAAALDPHHHDVQARLGAFRSDPAAPAPDSAQPFGAPCGTRLERKEA